MDLAWLVPLLALITLLALVVFAIVSKEKTERRRDDANAAKSTLAADAPDKRSGTPGDKDQST